jgi:hypothetical protein
MTRIQLTAIWSSEAKQFPGTKAQYVDVVESIITRDKTSDTATEARINGLCHGLSQSELCNCKYRMLGAGPNRESTNCGVLYT